jgi:hypothetical protein
MNVSGIFPLNVQLKNVTDLFAVDSLKIKYDPAVLRLNDIVPGDLISRDGGRVTSVKEIHAEVGEVIFSVTRLAGSPGVTGSGSLATMSFTALTAGVGTVTVTELNLKNTQAQPIGAILGETKVTIK